MSIRGPPSSVQLSELTTAHSWSASAYPCRCTADGVPNMPGEHSSATTTPHFARFLGCKDKEGRKTPAD